MDRWERIPAGQAPGGLWFRITAGGRIWREYGIPEADDLLTLNTKAVADAELSVALAGRFGESRLFVYDGDSGECVQTVVTPDGR